MQGLTRSTRLSLTASTPALATIEDFLPRDRRGTSSHRSHCFSPAESYQRNQDSGPNSENPANPSKKYSMACLRSPVRVYNRADRDISRPSRKGTSRPNDHLCSMEVGMSTIGSLTMCIHDLRSPDCRTRDEAARVIWDRFAARLRALAQAPRRPHPPARGRTGHPPEYVRQLLRGPARRQRVAGQPRGTLAPPGSDHPLQGRQYGQPALCGPSGCEA